ncbi:hypothetical protein AVEN_72034-1 [Araneus ventricosus]|uniref:Uncharacterized protein n=1 Tax=Araneus ventricosus TaxID=182803 RepID=A0A4Y2NJJ3_ARAVE|nr:hypothetical protein AVEN_72034-1 [Araneus ventricosus]
MSEVLRLSLTIAELKREKEWENYPDSTRYFTISHDVATIFRMPHNIVKLWYEHWRAFCANRVLTLKVQLFVLINATASRQINLKSTAVFLEKVKEETGFNPITFIQISTKSMNGIFMDICDCDVWST